MDRSQKLQYIGNQTFDLCVIGAGATGAGAALDAALRGLKVLLIDRDDFAAGTSSKSTKLIHGGVRYLEQAFKELDLAQLRQVRHGLEERAIVLANAPHLARPLALLTPVRSRLEGLYFSIGLKLYDQFASGGDALPPSRWLSKEETLRRIPRLSRRIAGAVLYYDGQLDDARYCLALARSAAEAGAVVLNHVGLRQFEKDAQGRLATAELEDSLTGTPYTVRSKVFLNCTGPYSDAVRMMANPDLPKRIRPSKGVHATLPGSVLGAEEALLIPKTKDGRVLFALPFSGKTLLGTTDTDYSGDLEPVLLEQEADFLLEGLNAYLSHPLQRSDISAGFGGLRPLLAASDRTNTGKLLRDHEVEHDAASNLFSVLGGKWTTYRLMAKDAIDAVDSQLQAPRSCGTATHRLVGAVDYHRDFWKTVQEASGFSDSVCRHLASNYGVDAMQVVALAQSNAVLAQPIVEGFPFVQAEIVFAVRHEMACTLRDVLARRLRLELIDWAVAAQVAVVVAQWMGQELGWTEQHRGQEVEKYQNAIAEWQQKAGLE